MSVKVRPFFLSFYIVKRSKKVKSTGVYLYKTLIDLKDFKSYITILVLQDIL